MTFPPKPMPAFPPKPSSPPQPPALRQGGPALKPEARRSRGVAWVIFAVVAVLLAGCAREHAPKTTTQASPSTAPTGGPCSYRPDARAAKQIPPPPGVPLEGLWRADIKTSLGVLTVDLDPKTPCTVTSFLHLAGRGFYNGSPCHRLVDSGLFVLQCGDPGGTGTGGPGYTFDDENLPSGATVVYQRGVLAMANSGRGTNGSQFFVVYKDSPLPPQYTIFGTVTGGLDTVDKVAAAGTSGAAGDGRPKQPIGIESVTGVQRRPVR